MSSGISIIDMTIVATMLVAVTVAGHLLTRHTVRGVSGFFKGDNDVPWWAVTASIIATKISALTFIALPAMVFVDGGNLRLAMVLGGYVLGNILMSLIFVKPYYDEQVYSPYDFIGKRIHPDVALVSRILFLAGTLLSQAVRLLATAVVLQVLSGMSMPVCILVMVVFSIIWSVLGGIKTVIWTDLMLFVIFMAGGLVALFTALAGADLALPEMLHVLDEKAKLAMLDISLDPTRKYTLWAGLFGASVFELGSNAIDQVITQRIMCCRTYRQARLAVAVSALSVIPTVIMLLVGLSLVLFFHRHGLPEAQAHLLNPGQDRIFPYFVAHHIPAGLSGIILAGIFASGISTLDSALTALAQTTVVGVRRSIGAEDERPEDRPDHDLLRRSRWFVAAWGLVILAVALVLRVLTAHSGEGLLTMGLRVPGFVYGSLLGLALLALRRRGSRTSAVAGAVAGCLVTLLLWQLGVGFFWWYPAAALVTYFAGNIKTTKREDT